MTVDRKEKKGKNTEKHDKNKKTQIKSLEKQ